MKEAEHVVVDAACLVDLMVATDVGMLLDLRLERRVLHAPGHIDAEVLAALGRLVRAGVLSPAQALRRVEALAVAPIERHPVHTLLVGAWRHPEHGSLTDSLYVELARSPGLTLITTDPALARVALPVAELVARPGREGATPRLG